LIQKVNAHFDFLALTGKEKVAIWFYLLEDLFTVTALGYGFPLLILSHVFYPDVVTDLNEVK
jgi:hypothetical protein